MVSILGLKQSVQPSRTNTHSTTNRDSDTNVTEGGPDARTKSETNWQS